MSNSPNLTGVWYGNYFATSYTESNSFIAVLAESSGKVSGTVTEPDDLQIAPIRRAYVTGNRFGQTIDFVKQYDGDVLAHHVEYSGIINPDCTAITGEWRFETYSGRFVMKRERFTSEELIEKADFTEDLPIGAHTMTDHYAHTESIVTPPPSPAPSIIAARRATAPLDLATPD